MGNTLPQTPVPLALLQVLNGGAVPGAVGERLSFELPGNRVLVTPIIISYN